HHVEEDEVGLALLDELEGGLPVLRLDDVVPLHAQQPAEQVPQHRLVVDDEDESMFWSGAIHALGEPTGAGRWSRLSELSELSVCWDGGGGRLRCVRQSAVQSPERRTHPPSRPREGPDERATGEGGRPEAAGNGPDRLVLPF